MNQKNNENGLCEIDSNQAASMFYDGFTITVDDNKELSLTDKPNMTEFDWNAHNYSASADAIMAEFELNSFIDNLTELEFDVKTDNENNARLEDYAADYFEDACLNGDYHSQYKWRMNYTTDQNIALSVMTGKTEYINGYLNDISEMGRFQGRAAELLNDLEDVKLFTKFAKSESDQSVSKDKKNVENERD